jgi:hypothetical protein
MSDSVDLSVGLLRKFAEFTRKLSQEELEAIVAGTLKFGLLEPPKPKVSTPIDAEAIRAELVAAGSREAASARIDSLKLQVPGLKQLAQSLGVSLAGATTKLAIRDRIVEHTIGFRLNSQTIRAGSWSP